MNLTLSAGRTRIINGFAPTLCLVSLLAAPCLAAKPHTPAERPVQKGEAKMETIMLWPGVAPGEKGDIGAELDTSNDPKDLPDKYVSRIGNVTRPTVAVFRPAKEKNTGAAVVVCPGGGYSILAYNLEGTEICQWLNAQGVTAFLLKYRVPHRAGLEKHAAPLQDAQRALGIVRSRAKEWNVDPHRVGILGFSAGGHLSVMASTQYDARTYPAIDEADKVSSRPDFAILIYPAYLTEEHDLSRLAPEIKVTPATPPTFIVQAEDDGVHVENAFTYALALKNAKVPVEMHIYPKGGHGYGLRPSPNAVSHWPQRAAEWLASEGWLKPKT